MTIKIAVLALQGAFLEHRKMLETLGADVIELRKKDDLEHKFDAIILPGGESTVQGKLLHELGMFEPLKQRISKDLPVLATCAGMILLAEKLDNDPTVHFGTLPVMIKRNAYGRQLGSFHADLPFDECGIVPMPFIRAPQITGYSQNVKIIAEYNGYPVAVKYRNQLAMTFHPEITGNNSIHNYFLKKIVSQFTMI